MEEEIKGCECAALCWCECACGAWEVPLDAGESFCFNCGIEDWEDRDDDEED